MEELKAHIIRLEQWYKHSGDHTILMDLTAKKNQLELLESCNAAKEIIFSRQKLHDFRDKSGTHLAQLLVEVSHQCWAG